MKGAACAFALALLVSCGEKPLDAALSSASPESSGDVAKKFLGLMESAQEDAKALKDEVARKNFGAPIRARLSAVRRSITSARELPYRKSGVDSDELRGTFSRFLDRTLHEVEVASWDEKNGTLLWKKLLAGCAACHQQFRD